jgi:glutamyl-tRNA synthetase
MENLKQNKSFVIRLKSMGSFDNKVKFIDQVKGEVELPENELDTVIMKGDGLPTYHFAHAIDDYLMGTTDVIRGDE